MRREGGPCPRSIVPRRPDTRAWVLVALLATAAPALAYLLPAPALLSRAAHKREEAKAGALTVQGTLALFGPSAEGAGVAEGLPIPATLRFTGPLSAQLELAAPSGAVVCSRQGAKAEVPPLRGGTLGGGAGGDCGGRNIPAARALVKDAVQLLAARRSPDSYSDYVASRGVDLNVVSLAREGGRVAYMIGAAPHDPQPRPQIWLDKDGFMPLRFSAPDADGQPLDLTFAVYGKPPLFDMWPRSIEIRRAGALEGRLTAESVESSAAPREATAPSE